MRVVINLMNKMNIGLLSVLRPIELKAVQKLSLIKRRRYFIAGYTDFDNQQLVLFRGDGSVVIAAFSMFQPSPINSPDFNDLEIIDYGQGVRLGSYEASTRSILIDLDPEYKQYCAEIQYNETIPGSHTN
jgi:hypothetical protein